MFNEVEPFILLNLILIKGKAVWQDLFWTQGWSQLFYSGWTKVSINFRSAYRCMRRPEAGPCIEIEWYLWRQPKCRTNNYQSLSLVNEFFLSTSGMSFTKLHNQKHIYIKKFYGQVYIHTPPIASPWLPSTAASTSPSLVVRAISAHCTASTMSSKSAFSNS